MLAALLGRLCELADGDERRQKGPPQHVPVEVGTVDGNCRKRSVALVDSGNLWRNCVSEGFLKRMGLTTKDIRPIEQKKILTAKEGATLEILGELRRPLFMSFGDRPDRYVFRPVVVMFTSGKGNLDRLDSHVNLILL